METLRDVQDKTIVDSPGRDVFKLRNGHVLGYAEYGSSVGTPIMAFHGMPGSRLMMKVVDKAASTAGARIFSPERPGYGLSKVAKTGLIEYASDVVELADALGIEKFAVMGVSGGGAFALACAFRYPERVSLAAIVSGIGPLALPGGIREMVPAQKATFQLGRYLPGVSGFLISRMVKSSLAMMDKHVRNGTSPTPDISPGLFEIMAEDQREAVRTGGRGIASDIKSLWRPWKFQLREIDPKVLLWHGEADNLAPTMLARYIAAQIPMCEAAFYPREGHTRPLTRHLNEIMARIASVDESGT